MVYRKNSAHTPLNAKFVVTMLIIDFVILGVSFFGIAGKLPGTAGLWCCIFVSTISISFLVAGLVSVLGSIRLICRLNNCEPIDAIITGIKKEKKYRRNEKPVYFPQMTYSFEDEKHSRIGNFGSSHPKWSVGDTIVLYTDAKTGNVAEKRDGFSGLFVGIFSIIFGAGITILAWSLFLL